MIAGVEGEITREISGLRSDGSIVLTGRPTIPDPDSEVLNTLYAGWSMAGDDGMTASRAVVGRQSIMYDNERWIGASAFRQNDTLVGTPTEPWDSGRLGRRRG